MTGGRRVWSAFEVLEAAEVNEYLSDQSVMRFDDDTARTAALPSPETGMITALDSENGRPEYWDGSAWVPVSQGVSVPNILVAGDPLNTTAAFTLTLSTWSLNTWYEISAGISSPIVIYATSTSAASTLSQIGTGAAGSEVVRAIFRSVDTSVQIDLFPYGVYVPANTRIAYRRLTGSTSSSSAQNIRYYTVSSGTTAEFGQIERTFSGTSWVEVGSSPPLAGGVWVVGLDELGNQGITYAFGASGSEVVQTNVILNSPGGYNYFPPFFWPPSTRLSLRAGNSAASNTIRTQWRETLDV
jgi:hypothetical protein